MGLRNGLCLGGPRRCAIRFEMVSRGTTTRCACPHPGPVYSEETYRRKLAIYVVSKQSAKLRQILGLWLGMSVCRLDGSEALVTCANGMQTSLTTCMVGVSSSAAEEHSHYSSMACVAIVASLREVVCRRFLTSESNNDVEAQLILFF